MSYSVLYRQSILFSRINTETMDCFGNDKLRYQLLVLLFRIRANAVHNMIRVCINVLPYAVFIDTMQCNVCTVYVCYTFVTTLYCGDTYFAGSPLGVVGK